MKVSDHQRALQQYREVVKLDRHNAVALAGAGRAATQLGQFSLAARYLAEALSVNPGDEQSAELLKVVKAIPALDPYETFVPTRRTRAALSAFDVAGDRLKQCLSASSESAGGPLQPLYTRWTDMRTTATERSLLQQPEQLDAIMDTVFSIEKQTSEICGTPSGADLALLLLARRHEGGSRE
jgi:tetratricopeptide (TPR) repeat protein